MLGLHKSVDAELSFMQMEIRSRLWWAIYCLDRQIGLFNNDIPSQIPVVAFPIPLPCADSNFNANCGPIDPQRSVRGHMIVLMGIYGRIMDTRNLPPTPYYASIIEASLMDWHSLVKDKIDISIQDERLANDYDYWLKLYTKAMYHGAYILLYREEFGEFCHLLVLSEIQRKILLSCVSSASSIVEISHIIGKVNPKSLYICPFIDVCWYLAGFVYLKLKKSRHTTNLSEDSFKLVLKSLEIKSKFSNFASVLLQGLSV